MSKSGKSDDQDHENNHSVEQEENEEEGEELEMDEYQSDKHNITPRSSHRSEISEKETTSKPKIVSNFKIRRKMQTFITDFYESFEQKFHKKHPYIQVKRDSERARATLIGMHRKRENINNEIIEPVAIKILNQENEVLWGEIKKLNQGLTVIIDEYNKTRMSDKYRKRQAKLQTESETRVRKYHLMK